MKKYTQYILISLFIIATLISICFVPIGISRMIPQMESQVEKDLGVKVHMDKLILRVGPFVKIKSPVIYLMYENGQNFGQFSNIKFYISWLSLLHKKPIVCKLYANKLVLNVNSDDKQLPELLKRLQTDSQEQAPNVYLKEYAFTYYDKLEDERYRIAGSGLVLSKMKNFKNWKIKTDGNFYINDRKFLNISVDVKNKYNIENRPINADIKTFINQLKMLEFYSDVISDLTIYKNKDDVFQASGFVNIDNISILDKSKKCPKSYIYTTLLGNKASVLSNIYTDENKKVYVDGMINNSKRVNIDLKVKTDEIELGDLYQKLRVLSFFTDLKNLTSLSGKLEANFALKGDLSKIKSNGYLKISDAKLDANGIQIEHINSDIDLSNNRINIKNAVGMVKKAPISAKGSIDKNIDIEVNMSQVPIKYLCPENFGIKDGIITLVSTIKGNVDNIIHKEKIQVDNLKIDNNKQQLRVGTISIDTNKNNTAYITNLLYNSPMCDMIKIPSLKPIIEKESIIIPFTKVFMPNSQFEMNGKITDYYNKNAAFNIKLDGRLNTKDVKQDNIIADVLPVKISVNGNKFTQDIIIQFLLEKATIFTEPSVLSAVLKKDNQNIKIDEMVVADYNGQFTDDYKANIKNNKKIIINGLIENINNPVFKNVRLFIPQNININFANTVGQIKGDVFINGSYKKPDIIGQLSVSNLFNQVLHMTIINSIFDFNKNIVIFNMPNVKIADFTICLTGTASTDNITKELNIKQLNIKSKYVNADTFLTYKDVMISKKYPVIISDAKFYIEKLQATLYASPLYLSAVTGDFKTKGNIINIKNLTAEAFNGKLAGKIDYNLNEDTYTSAIMAREISAAPIFAMVSDKNDTISGVMDLDANLSGSLTSKSFINGNLKFIIHNGRMSTFGRLEHLLYAQNVVADNMLRTSLSTITKAISLKDTGLFKYLRGAVTIKNGLADVHYIQSQGPLMALYIKGQYSINDETARFSILGRLSDEVVSGLGTFGDFSFDKLRIMITGEENKYKINNKDLEMLPQLSARNTKEFYSLINGNIRKSSSVILFNWISYTEKSLRQKDVPMSSTPVPSFIDELPY